MFDFIGFTNPRTIDLTFFYMCYVGPACGVNTFAGLPGSSVCPACTAHASSSVNAAECTCDPGFFIGEATVKILLKRCQEFLIFSLFRLSCYLL